MWRKILSRKILHRIRNEQIKQRTKLIEVREHVEDTMRKLDDGWNKRVQEGRLWIGRKIT